MNNPAMQGAHIKSRTDTYVSLQQSHGGAFGHQVLTLERKNIKKGVEERERERVSDTGEKREGKIHTDTSCE